MKKINWRSITFASIISLIIFVLILTISLIKDISPNNYLPAICITEAGFAILWWVALKGGFSTFSSSTRKLGGSLKDRKLNKLGAYNPEKKKERKNNPWEIEEKAKTKSRHGIYFMLLISVIELLVTLPFII